MFPTTTVLDDFNRANEGPPPSASWTTWISSGLKVVSNEIGPNDTGGNGAYWNAVMPGPDVEAHLTIATLSDATTYINLYARYDVALFKGYVMNHTVASPDTWALVREDGGSSATLVSGTQDLSNGDAMGIRCVGSLIEGWLRVNGIWQRVGSATDATYSGASPNDRLGIYTEPGAVTTGRMDNFGGGVVRHALAALGAGA